MLILTLYTESFAEVIIYFIFCFRSVTTSSPPPREQTEGARNLSASEREATPPTPDQTSQVRTTVEPRLMDTPEWRTPTI